MIGCPFAMVLEVCVCVSGGVLPTRGWAGQHLSAAPAALHNPPRINTILNVRRRPRAGRCAAPKTHVRLPSDLPHRSTAPTAKLESNFLTQTYKQPQRRARFGSLCYFTVLIFAQSNESNIALQIGTTNNVPASLVLVKMKNFLSGSFTVQFLEFLLLTGLYLVCRSNSRSTFRSLFDVKYTFH